MKKICLIVFLLACGLFFSLNSSCLALTDSLQTKQVERPKAFQKKKPGFTIKKKQPIQSESFPVITTINPARVTQGQQVMISLSGRHLKSNMKLVLGNGITIDNLKLVNETATIAIARLRASPGAAPGKRTVSILYKDQVKPTPIFFTVNAAYHSPVIKSISPGMLLQGKSYSVVLTGTNLGSLKTVDFGPGIMIKGKSVNARSGQSVMIKLNVSAKAKPGIRIVQPVDERGPHPGSARITVMAAAPSPIRPEMVKPGPAALPKNLSDSSMVVSPPLSFQLSGMTPNRWHAGNVYDVTAFGTGFEKNMQLSLGNDIRIDQIKVKTSGQATFKIHVDKKAVYGPRQLKLRSDSHQAWTATTARGFVIPVFSSSPELPKMIRHAALKDIEFVKGTIELETPEYGEYKASENNFKDHGIPVVNDEVEFTWKEEQYGASQWFELRILDKDNHVLVKRKIEGQPLPNSFFIPDTAFINAIFSALRPDAQDSGQAGDPGQVQTSVSGSAASKIKLSGKSSAKAVKKVPAPVFHDGRVDCYWQVAGFKRYISYAYNSAAGKNMLVSNDVEIAVSDRWPLAVPEYSPTGLICSAANTQLTPSKVNKNTGELVSDNNFFVGDTLQISGKFTLDGCPWSIKYTPHWGNPIAGPVADTLQVMNWTFSNVFIDWGDGKYDLVTALPTEEMLAHEGVGTAELTPGSGIWEPNDAAGKPMGMLDFAMTHTYRYPQKFPVRLFVLPEQDAGKIDSIVQANKSPVGGSVYQAVILKKQQSPDNPILLAASGMTASDMPGPVASAVSKKGGSKFSVAPKSKAAGMSAAPKSTPSITAGFEPAGSNAFLLYCQPRVVDIKPDPFATGDLHLINIAVDRFSGQKAQSSGVVEISGLPGSGGRTTLPAPGQKTINLPPKTNKSRKFSITGNAKKDLELKTPGLLQVFPESDAVASSCDEGLYATARLEYFGLGRIILIWTVDGVEIARSFEDVGPSPVRTQLDNEGNYTEEVKTALITFVSPKLPLDIGDSAYKQYHLSVSAIVDGYENAEYMDPVDQWVGGVHLHTPGSDEYLKYVSRTSDPKTYLVKTPTPGEPCKFKFPVGDNRFFTVSNIQGRVAKKNGRYSGEGTLYFSLPDRPGGMGSHFADIHINNWTVNDQGVVTKGSINEINMNITMDDLPGVSGVLKQLKGKAGEPLSATMDITVKDSGLHRVGAIKPPEWLNVKADLVPEDGWQATGLAMPETEIYWSDFRISSNDVTLDLSRLRGDRPVSRSPIRASANQITTSGSGNKTRSSQTHRPSKTTPETTPSASAYSTVQNGIVQGVTASSPNVSGMVLMWAGVNLGDTAKLYPFLFDLAEMDVAAKGWSITDSGIQGKARFNHFSYVLGDGSISFDGIDIEAADHRLDALYKGVKVNIPWPKVSLDGGDATVSYTQGQDASNVAFHFNLNNMTVTEDYQNITMAATIKGFERRGSGWGILTDTIFKFSDGKNAFVTTELSDLFFNVFGEAHFTGSGSQVHHRTIPLNQATIFGDTDFALAGLNVHAPADHLKSERLSFTFNGQIDFGDAFNAPDVKVFYKINKPLGSGFQAQGPGHSDIRIHSSFPGDANPLTRLEVRPEINLPGSTGLGFQPPEDHSLLSVLTSGIIPDAHADTGVQDTFTGAVNAEMFGVDLPGVGAAFRYGRYNNQTYWLTHLTGSHIDIPIFTNGVNLKEVNGGIAHGFNADVFNGNPMTATPAGSETFYSAGITIGSPSPANIYRLKGQLTVDLNDPDPVIQMGFNPVSIFGFSLGGGHFQYANSVFEGSVFGHFSLYQGALACDIPPNSNRVGLHFGNDYWEIWAGKKATPITIKLLNMAKANGYYQFGSQAGYKVGGGMSFNTKKICVAAFSGQVSAGAGMGMSIAPGNLNGSFWIGVDLNVWVPCGGKHFSFGPTIEVDVSAPPLSMTAKARFKLPKWAGGGGHTFRFSI